MDDLRRLFDNNRKLVEQVTRDDPDFFKRKAGKQEPHFLFIGCADSRVPLETLTGVQPGEMFVHRNIANQVLAGRSEPAVGAAVRGRGAGRQARDRLRAPPVRRRASGDGRREPRPGRSLAGRHPRLAPPSPPRAQRLRRRTGQVRPAGGAERAAPGLQPGADADRAERVEARPPANPARRGLRPEGRPAARAGAGGGRARQGAGRCSSRTAEGSEIRRPAPERPRRVP